MPRLPLPSLAALGLGLLGLAACAGRKAAAPETWAAMPSAQRQERLSREPALDTRVIKYNKGQIEFLARRPAAGAALRADSSVLPIVYVHGLGGSLGDFAPLILATDPGRTAVALNLPGTGRSSNEEGDFTIKAHAEAIHEVLMLRMGYAKADLVCHSLGGQVCIALALEYPACVSSLVLIDVAGSYRQEEFVQRMASTYVKVNIGQVQVANHPAMSIFTGGNQSIINRLIGGDPILISALDSFNQTYRDRIRNLSVPVLIIWGEKDPVFLPQYGFFLLSNIPGARMKVVPEAGHVPQLSHAGLVRRWIGDFHQSLARAAD